MPLLHARRSSCRAPLVALVAALLLAVPGRARDVEVPLELQAVFFKKILAYDPALQAPGAVRVLVVHPRAAEADARAVVDALARVGISATPATLDEATARLDGFTVVYVMAGVAAPVLRAKLAARGVLSISGTASLADGGEVSLAMGRSPEGKPEIVVHRGRLREERHELSARLLSLARVIQ